METENERYIVAKIEEKDYGCEGVPEGKSICVYVDLKDNQEKFMRIEAEDALLCQRKIKEGCEVTLHPQYGILKIVSVVAAVIKSRNWDDENVERKIFATQRGYGEYKDGWEFPGGKVELGETSQQALEREILEELDTKINIEEWIDTIEYDYPTFHLSMECFFANILSGKLELKEHEAAKWLTAESLSDVEWLPADITLIEKVKEKMNSKNKEEPEKE